MSIPEAQLDTWAKQGSITQSAQTYQTIKGVLEDSGAPYYAKNYSVFLQGSYGNDTNVYRESDVDIVMQLNSTFYSDLTELEPAAKDHFDKAHPDVPYGWHEFRAEVLAWLQINYGSDVQPGKRAIFIKGNGYRRDADVVVCAKLRKYHKGSTGSDGSYTEGICFFLPDNTRIVNYPKRHLERCTNMHQATNGWFKPTVRVFKNMRNRMISDSVLKEGVAPSYFIEGMLWNVPNETFGKSYDNCVVGSYNWILEADKTRLVTASGMHWLIRDGAHTSWPTANFQTYFDAVKEYWDGWGS